MLAWAWYIVKLALAAVVVLGVVCIVVGVVNDYRDFRDEMERK